ncbi:MULTISPECIES: CDGSH iron-sulfur domain-containing protein [Nocardioides]|uniref:CDGSH iron-sulfur domain-containing protein n=1 Tax=Nocardioides vastitatis TaxID=2568655 RepID=A0ABW0ZJ68_9ACTN|nr:CDGSH iron-sulfur domain-containing protein [Nocardioides sp.]THI91594.1 CDGSH iron-sulfur domain-containing protein [Nocardioides sp.]
MSARRVTVQDCPGGPLLIRGADEVVAADGTVAEATRPVVAVCRCGRSARLPWCDASHRAKRRSNRDD